MKVYCKSLGDTELRPFDVKDGMTIEELWKEYPETLSENLVTSKVNGIYQPVNTELHDGDLVVLLGLSYRPAIRVYENSLGLLLITAYHRVLGNHPIVVVNSLDQGLYVERKDASSIPHEEITLVEKEMRRLVEQDEPFLQMNVSMQEAVKRLNEQEEMPYTIERMQRQGETVPIISIGDIWHYEEEISVPSAGYLKYFELVKYQKGVLLRYPNSYLVDKIPPLHNQKGLFQAFDMQDEWEQSMGANYVADLNQKVRDGEYLDILLMSEALQEKRMVEIADSVKERNCRIVLVAGPSSSGKTTFAKKLSIEMRLNQANPIYLSTDDYFVNREDMIPDENGKLDFESLDAVDLKLFAHDMNALLNGEEVDIPTFNFITGKKEFGQRITKIGAEQGIIIEGIHALNRKLTEGIPEEQIFRVYISPLTQMNLDEHHRIPTTDERMLRRMVRDNRARGRNAETTIEQWEDVRAGEDVNIFPNSSTADVIYNSYHLFEIPLLKKFAQPILEEVPRDSEQYAEAQRMLKLLSHFETIEDESDILKNSIIREFIGGSMFE